MRLQEAAKGGTMRTLGPVFLLFLAAPLQAQTAPVAIDSAVFVERSEGTVRTIEEVGSFRKGERVVTVLRWQAPRGSYTVTSPVPPRLQFEGASAEDVEVSTDGGRTWRRAALARPEMVTHLRWRVGSGPGRLTYSAIVR
jgi:hypothetical protein